MDNALWLKTAGGALIRADQIVRVFIDRGTLRVGVAIYSGGGAVDGGWTIGPNWYEVCRLGEANAAQAPRDLAVELAKHAGANGILSAKEGLDFEFDDLG